MKRRFIKVSGKTAAIYFNSQWRFYQDAEYIVSNANDVSLAADGAAVDNAYKVCRYCFTKFQNMKQQGIEHGLIFQSVERAKYYNFLLFCDLLTAYFGLEKDC